MSSLKDKSLDDHAEFQENMQTVDDILTTLQRHLESPDSSLPHREHLYKKMLKIVERNTDILLEWTIANKDTLPKSLYEESVNGYKELIKKHGKSEDFLKALLKASGI